MIVIWFFLDMTLKFVVGMLLALLIWSPFGCFFGAAPVPWIIGGAVLGVLLNGYFELCDVFGLKRILGIRE